jgi:regulator of cell morphogenesis and NO signaling
VFELHGIDFCCGGKKAIGEVCRERGLSLTGFTSAIQASADVTGQQSKDWSRQPLDVLIDHILTTYHQPLHKELPRLEAMASKVAQVHGSGASELARVSAIMTELAADLELHMRKEEMVLFPAIKALEAGTSGLPVPFSAPITVMEQDHDRAGELLAELRSLSQDYQVPEWGCATWRALYQGLAELESAMHLHVHLENNVLFPRALQLEEARVTA